MKQNLYDIALEGVWEYVEEVSDGIAREFRKVTPFDKVPATSEEITAQFNMLPLEEKIRLLSQTGGRQ